MNEFVCSNTIYMIIIFFGWLNGLYTIVALGKSIQLKILQELPLVSSAKLSFITITKYKLPFLYLPEITLMKKHKNIASNNLIFFHKGLY